MEKTERKMTVNLYRQLAEKHGVTVGYIGKIARGERIPVWSKKAKEVLKDLQQVSNIINN